MYEKVYYIKLDVNDVMEILLEHYQKQFENSDYAKGIFLGTPDNELRFIAAFGDYQNKELHSIDLNKIDKEMDYNGDHAFLKNNPNFTL